ncbi:hypothetical protein L7F22_011794 [Adiantum nelumboides]|nr:hypothetical protein [Adiantum nelumboides]
MSGEACSTAAITSAKIFDLQVWRLLDTLFETSAVADALAVSVRLGPHALSLQRCFGFCPAAAGNLLAAAAAEGSQLQCVLLSHLDRLDLPRYAPLSEVPVPDVVEAGKFVDTLHLKPSFNPHTLFTKELHDIASRIAGITVLALHNCGNLGAHELFSVGSTCPHLEYLLIGGSVEALHLRSDMEVATMSVTALVESIKNFRCLRVLEATFFPGFVLQSLRYIWKLGLFNDWSSLKLLQFDMVG